MATSGPQFGLGQRRFAQTPPQGQPFLRALQQALHGHPSDRSGTARPTLPYVPHRLRHAPAVLAMGASLGGTVAIEQVLLTLPRAMPPIVVTQHLPTAFSGAFAQRLNNLTFFQVAEAKDGQRLQPGQVYIAPGDRHLILTGSPEQPACQLGAGRTVSGHRPSVDAMFHSAAEAYGDRTLAVLLTGMGQDGAAGMLALHRAGGHTIAQNKHSSVVWSMPQAAVLLGAVDHLAPLAEIGPLLRTLLGKPGPMALPHLRQKYPL